MRKKIVIFSAAAAGVIILCAAAAIAFHKPKDIPVRDIPEYIMPGSSAQEEQPDIGALETNVSSESAETSAPAVFSESAESAESTESAKSGELDTPYVPEETAENVLLTSKDPEHFIRFEFLPDRIMFSGVYTGDVVSWISIFDPEIICGDLAYSGDGFSGSLDTSRLDRGFYVICVRLDSGAGMYYVFNVTEQGAQPVPEDKLPAERNLSCTEHPLELPAETVLEYITPSKDRDRAAEILQQIRELSDSICDGLDNDFDKARALSEWVSHNTFYDWDAKENGVSDEMLSLEYILEYHRSVCFGWSNLYSALCQAQGIECYNASGSAVTGSRCFLQTELSEERSHSWNMVIVDGEKVWVDTVWNSSNMYKYGEYNYGSCDLQYFGITNGLLAHDHRAVRFEHRDYFDTVG